MTPEELERVMNFIIERQERMAAQQEGQQFLLDALLSSQKTLTATVMQIANGVVERFDRQDAEMSALREAVGDLTRTVDRYITARGNGSNGRGGQG
jgi:flagellar biosynthesis/type III secretory pathway protein FliH